MKALVATLALTSALVAVPASAQNAGSMTISEFRQRDEARQTYMVLGAIALTDKLDIMCPVMVTVAEWRAALVHRQFDVSRLWIDALLELMDERGCRGEEKKADT
jgi:hypothetical protein